MKFGGRSSAGCLGKRGKTSAERAREKSCVPELYKGVWEKVSEGVNRGQKESIISNETILSFLFSGIRQQGCRKRLKMGK